MNEQKDSAIKRYFKENLVVLLFELIIVVLLACICSLMLGGEPVWLAPTLAVFAYLMAELRFMMSYMAEQARRDKAEKAPLPEDAPIKEEADDEATQQAAESIEETLDGEEWIQDLDEDEDEDIPFVPPVLKYTEKPFDDSFFDEPEPDMTEENSVQSLLLEDDEEPVTQDALMDDSLDEGTEDSTFDSVELAFDDELWGDLDESESEITVSDGLMETDIDLLDESDSSDEDLSDEDIYRIFERPIPKIEDAPETEVPFRGVLDLSDDEDPFSH